MLSKLALSAFGTATLSKRQFSVGLGTHFGALEPSWGMVGQESSWDYIEIENYSVEHFVIDGHYC